MAGSVGSTSVCLCVVMMLSSTVGSGMLVQKEAAAVHPSVHILVVKALIDISCRQECFLLLHVLEGEQTGGNLEAPTQLQGNATLLQVNTVDVSQLPAATYVLTVSCSKASLCSCQPPVLHFSRLPYGTVTATGSHAHVAADANLPQVQVLESSFRVVHGHGIAATAEEQSQERDALGRKKQPTRYTKRRPKYDHEVNGGDRGCRFPCIVSRIPGRLQLAEQGSMDVDYEHLDAPEKLEKLWNSIQGSIYPEGTALPTKEPGVAEELGLLWAPHLRPSFLHTSDILPAGRSKLIHTFGSVAKVTLKMDSASRYTGIFKSGGVGLLRISAAKQHFGSFQPGAGLKILINKRPSVNFLVMPSLDGQGDDFNAFSNSYTNVLKPPESAALKVVAVAFECAVAGLSKNPAERPEDARHLPMLEAAQVLSDGTPVPEAEARAPYQIIFEPTPEITESYKVWMNNDVRLGLAQVPAGTVLFHVKAKASAAADAEVIGSLVTDSKFVASEFGDRALFFQHMRHRSMGGATEVAA